MASSSSPSSPSSALPIIAVVGVTGAQGGSVARHLLRTGPPTFALALASSLSPTLPPGGKSKIPLSNHEGPIPEASVLFRPNRRKFHVRGLARNPASPAAVEMAKLGVEIIKGDLHDSESLRPLVEGVQGAFIITTLGKFEKTPEQEKKEGKNFVDALLQFAPGLKLLIISSVPRPPKGEDYTGHLHEGKFWTEDYARQKGLPLTVTMAGFYYENWLDFWAPPRGWNGRLFFWVMPTEGHDTALAYLSIEDYGGPIAQLFLQWKSGLNQLVATEVLTFSECLRILGEVRGEPIDFAPLSRKVYSHMPLPAAAMKEIMKAGEFWNHHGHWKADVPAAIEFTKSSYPGTQTFKDWAASHAQVIKNSKPGFPHALVYLAYTKLFFTSPLGIASLVAGAAALCWRFCNMNNVDALPPSH